MLVVDTTNGRVGVNKAPGYPLDVYGNCRISGSADINLLLERTNNSKAVSLTFNPTGSLGSSNKQWFFRLWPNTSNIHMCTYDGTTIGYVLSLMADGKVGICDTSPAEVLDVNGNINTTGVIKVDDVQVVSNRYIDSKINNNPGDTYDNPTKNLISCMKATLLAHGLVAAS